MLNRQREKSDKALQLRSIISSLVLGLSFIGSIIFFFFHLLMFMVGHAGEIIWPLALGIVSLSVFLFSLIYYIIIYKIRKEKVRENR
ncbi:MAG: hypothetical protein HGN29_13350 [Asgard group archaeon]|nr:hypothetical protein [Asgard group archaeon]